MPASEPGRLSDFDSALLLVFRLPGSEGEGADLCKGCRKTAAQGIGRVFPELDPQIAEAFFAAIGPDGRAAYRRFYWIMDFWFPGATASLAIASLMLIAFPPASGWAWLSVIAAPSWLFDVAENITHFQMAGSYPNLSSVAVKFGPLFTGAKWVFAILPLPIALGGLIFRSAG